MSAGNQRHDDFVYMHEHNTTTHNTSIITKNEQLTHSAGLL